MCVHRMVPKNVHINSGYRLLLTLSLSNEENEMASPSENNFLNILLLGCSIWFFFSQSDFGHGKSLTNVCGHFERIAYHAPFIYIKYI